MSTPARSIRRIKGLSDERRLPRLGKIRLGIKVKNAQGAEYPRDVDYFVCPPEVMAKYGPQPRELDVMLPIEDETMVFPQALKWYEQSGLRCKGDGEVALRRRENLVVKNKAGQVVDDARKRVLSGSADGDPNDLVEIGCAACPLREVQAGEKAARCGEKASLMVLLPGVNMGGVYQVDTGSINNIVNLNSTIDYVRAMAGRIALVPLKLRRVKTSIQYEGKRVDKWLLSLDMDLALPELVAYRRDAHLILARQEGLVLPAPKEDGPDDAPGAVVREVENDAEDEDVFAGVEPSAAARAATAVVAASDPEADRQAELEVDNALAGDGEQLALVAPPAQAPETRPDSGPRGKRGTPARRPALTGPAVGTKEYEDERTVLAREIWVAANAVRRANKDGSVIVPGPMAEALGLTEKRNSAAVLARRDDAADILTTFREMAGV